MRRSSSRPSGRRYDRWGSILSFGQDPRWRRFLVECTDAGPFDTVLDVATGTAAVALELVRQKDCYVVGIDQSPGMLEAGRRRVTLAAATRKVRLEEGDAQALPFEDGLFDALTFTYLLRYVEDPQATLRELARVVKPGGTIAGLEFGVPRGVWRPLWEAWVRVGLPGAGRLIGGGWHEVGAFLGPSITQHYEQWPLPRLLQAWRDAGIERGAGTTPQPRRRHRHLGPQVGVTDETVRPAWYALRAGGWRDWVTLLHPPYTLWNLSYVAVGAALAPRFHFDRLLWALAAFFLAMGVAAHALDELNGRPLRTAIPSPALAVAAFVALGGAIGIGLAAASAWGWWLLVFVAVGAVLVPAYNLELFGGVLHNDWGFALAWGAFPALTGWFVEAQSIRFEALAIAAYAAALSLAQRTLSTPVRRARRSQGTLEGTETIERTLRWLTCAATAIAVGVVAARLR